MKAWEQYRMSKLNSPTPSSADKIACEGYQTKRGITTSITGILWKWGAISTGVVAKSGKTGFDDK